MALQVWLPLNGKMENQGLSGAAMSGGPASYGNGPLGKCGVFNGQYISIPWESTSEQMTLCCWFYPNSPGSWSDVFSFGEGNNRFEKTTTTSYQWYASSVPLLSSGSIQGDFPDKTWCHFALVANGEKCYIYINGKLQNTFNQLNSLSTVFGGTKKFFVASRIDASSKYTGSITDIRLYDNALSPKEVHEIAQGLCCHYPLNMVDGKIFGRNLIKNSTLANKLPDGAGSEWMNSVTSVTYDGEACHLVTPNEGNFNNGIGFTWSDFTLLGITKGDTITFSFDVKGTSDSNKPNTNIAIQNTATTWYDSGHLESSRVYFVPTDEYKRVSLTYTIPTDAAFTSKKIWLAIHGNMQSDLYIKNLKLEKGSSATYWTPAVEDYPGLYDDVVYDTSGFGNHGSVAAASAPILAGDSARYDRCYEFDGTNDYITVKNPFNSSMTEFSISCWANISYGTTQTLYTARTSVGNGIALFVYNNSLRLDDNTQTFFSYDMTSYNNKWTHICLTRNAAQKKLYVNGTLVATAASTSDMGNIGVNGTIGGSENQDDGIGVGNWLKGKLSDFRLYATALSDDDVAALYKTPISVTSDGAMIVKGEVIESI